MSLPWRSRRGLLNLGVASVMPAALNIYLQTLIAHPADFGEPGWQGAPKSRCFSNSLTMFLKAAPVERAHVPTLGSWWPAQPVSSGSPATRILLSFSRGWSLVPQLPAASSLVTTWTSAAADSGILGLESRQASHRAGKRKSSPEGHPLAREPSLYTCFPANILWN